MQSNDGDDLLSHSTRTIYLRANRGDQDALDALLMRMRPRLQAWVALRMGPTLKAKLEADDIVQEILMKAAGAIESFEPRGEHGFHAWLFTIARNQLYEWQRRMSAAKRSGDEELIHSGFFLDETGPSTWTSRREELDLVLRTLTQLPDRHREIIRLKSIECLSNAEAAQKMGISPKNASVLHVRAMTDLRKRLTGGKEDH